MRLRNVPGAKEEMLVNPFVVQEPASKKGAWAEVFGTKRPLMLEIGTGKGQFITTLAGQNPDVNFIGIEKMSSVLIRALQKRAEQEIDNLYFLRMDAEEVVNTFDKGEVAKIYLNFSDPWPKDRHHKRRLTSREFLARYEQILAEDGIVEFKTDNVGLFDFSLEEIEAAGWTLLACTRDLHHDTSMNGGNVMTEYEERFSSMGNPICKLICAPAKKAAEKEQ